MSAFNLHNISLPNKFTGQDSEYNRGITTLCESMAKSNGSVNFNVCIFPEKPCVLIFLLDRGRCAPCGPITECVAPVSTKKGKVC